MRFKSPLKPCALRSLIPSLFIEFKKLSVKNISNHILATHNIKCLIFGFSYPQIKKQFHRQSRQSIDFQTAFCNILYYFCNAEKVFKTLNTPPRFLYIFGFPIMEGLRRVFKTSHNKKSTIVFKSI